MRPTFDSNGSDETTFAPFVLEDCRDTEYKDLRLRFSDWDWLHKHCGGDTVDDYYLNGYGVQDLVLTARVLNGLEPISETMDTNSEGDTCYIHFSNFDEAVRTAEISASMIRDMGLLRQAVAAAKENGFGD
jgi:hypothetical protein